MDCNCNQRSAGSCRPQMPPPCMNTNCGCGSPMPMPPIQPRMGEQGGVRGRSIRPPYDSMPPAGIMPCSDGKPSCGMEPSGIVSPGVVRPAAYRPSPMQCTIETANKPLAMAYVPWQQWRQTYPLDKALSRGTIFPELDLPFVMGRCR